MTLSIHLRDEREDMVTAWRGYFQSTPHVIVSWGNILAPEVEPVDAIISPANSFGFMDGGVDLAYSRFFGTDLQDRLRSVILREHDGELPVGQALILATEHPRIGYLVSAPTMRVPMDISDTTNVYLAFRAALQMIVLFNETAPAPIQRVLCPGFGTGYGRMPAKRAALQMHEAYSTIILGERSWSESIDGIHRQQRRLLR